MTTESAPPSPKLARGASLAKLSQPASPWQARRDHGRGFSPVRPELARAQSEANLGLPSPERKPFRLFPTSPSLLHKTTNPPPLISPDINSVTTITEPTHLEPPRRTHSPGPIRNACERPPSSSPCGGCRDRRDGSSAVRPPIAIIPVAPSGHTAGPPSSPWTPATGGGAWIPDRGGETPPDVAVPGKLPPSPFLPCYSFREFLRPRRSSVISGPTTSRATTPFLGDIRAAEQVSQNSSTRFARPIKPSQEPGKAPLRKLPGRAAKAKAKQGPRELVPAYPLQGPFAARHPQRKDAARPSALHRVLSPDVRAPIIAHLQIGPPCKERRGGGRPLAPPPDGAVIS